jgi:tetratricopeptide (TPR) repeat protein
MRFSHIVIATLGALVISGASALADGGGGGNGDRSGTTCGADEVYNSASQRCERRRAGVLPDNMLTDYAYALAKAGRYAEAIDVLDLLQNPRTPVALNYRGYATRKLGRVDEGIGYYLQSVTLDPHYAQVREYLGEAYLVKGDKPAAEAQLAAIKQICGTTCDEYQHLAVAIADPSNL